MDQVEQQELKKLVEALHAALCAGPYHDVASNTIIHLYLKNLGFWNRRFAIHCQSLEDMRNCEAELQDKRCRASRQEKEKQRKHQVSQIASINTECEAAERLSRIMEGALGTRAQLLRHRGFTLSFQVDGGDRSEVGDSRGLVKGIQRHLAHWEPWWMSLENYLKFTHQDLKLEMGFFRCLWDPSSATSRRSGIKIFGILEQRLKRLSGEQSNGLDALKSACSPGDARRTHIQSLLSSRVQAMRDLSQLLRLLREVSKPGNPERVLRKRKRTM